MLYIQHRSTSSRIRELRLKQRGFAVIRAPAASGFIHMLQDHKAGMLQDVTLAVEQVKYHTMVCLIVG